MAMRLPTSPTQGPRRGLPRTSGSFSIAALRTLASPLGESASPAISGTTFERSRMRPFESMIPGFSPPLGPKRTSFMDSPWGLIAVWHGSVPGPRMMRRVPPKGQGKRPIVQVCFRERLCPLWLLPMGNRCADIVQACLFTRRFHLQWALSADRLASCTWLARLAASDAGSGADTMASPLLRALPGYRAKLGGATGPASAGLVRVWG